MKTFLFTLFLIISTTNSSCNRGQSDNILDITYIIQARGTYKQIKFSKDLILFFGVINNKKHSKKTPKTLWLEMHNLLNQLNLNELHKIKVTSNEKSRDAALTAYIEISLKNEKTLTSSHFDHGNPPEELEAIVNILLSQSENMD